jgi:hypothetical protein
MKKVIQGGILIGLVLISITFTKAVAQTKWGAPIRINIFLPAKISFGADDNIPPSGHSSNTIVNDSIVILSGFTSDSGSNSFTENNDTIDAVGNDRSIPWIVQRVTLHCVIDTTTKTINDFSWSFLYDYEASSGYTRINQAISFIPLSYVTKPDSSLEVNDTGAVCRTSISSVNYTSVDYRQLDKQGGYTETGQVLNSLIEDTSSYRCFINISLYPPKPVSAVCQCTYVTRIFMATVSLPDHSIHFSFPAADHPQQLSIYDILGREVSRVEIAAGSSSYQMTSTGYPKGTYFARLGMQTASFMVN